MIAIVEYGLGNIQAIANIYKRLNIPLTAVTTPDGLFNAEKIILPGVGAFDRAMACLNASGMKDALNEAVITRGIPVLGICVGMQMMATRSSEGVLNGLDWIAGEVKKFDFATASERAPLPHMGWNDVRPLKGEGLFGNLSSDARFYFLHSYYFRPLNEEHVLAVTDYNGLYASSVNAGNIFGVQFHPEKSHHFGVQLLKNFAEI